MPDHSLYTPESDFILNGHPICLEWQQAISPSIILIHDMAYGITSLKPLHVPGA